MLLLCWYTKRLKHALLSLIKFFEKCWNVSTCLSIRIFGSILKKTVSLILETQITNNCTIQETRRCVLWSYSLCYNISACLSMFFIMFRAFQIEGCIFSALAKIIEDSWNPCLLTVWGNHNSVFFCKFVAYFQNIFC